MNVRGQPIKESGSFGRLGAHAFGTAEQRARRSPQCARDLLDGRQRRVTAAILDRAEVVRREPSALGQLLQREPESPTVSSDTRAKGHEVDLREVMPSRTTIEGVDQSTRSCCEHNDFELFCIGATS